MFDIYEFCTDELKKSLDLGRDFERRIREEEDVKRLTGQSDDVEMKDANVGGSGAGAAMHEEEKVSATAARNKRKELEQKISDEALYRPHG